MPMNTCQPLQMEDCSKWQVCMWRERNTVLHSFELFTWLDKLFHLASQPSSESDYRCSQSKDGWDKQWNETEGQRLVNDSPLSSTKRENHSRRQKEKLVDDSEWRWDWQVVVDLANEHYRLPIETRKTPDLAVYSTERKVLKYFDLTVCWEAGMESARIRKEERYLSLLKSCTDQGWASTRLPFEVGVRGIVGKRAMSLLKHFGFNCPESKKLVEQIEETIENASRFIWNKKDVA